jgi:hypothetical protein
MSDESPATSFHSDARPRTRLKPRFDSLSIGRSYRAAPARPRLKPRANQSQVDLRRLHKVREGGLRPC